MSTICRNSDRSPANDWRFRMTSWTSVELTVGADDGGALAPTLVFAADGTLFAPDALRDRVAAGIGVATFEAKPGRWLDLVGKDGQRIVVVAIGAEDSDD